MHALRWSYASDLVLVAVLGAATLVTTPHHRCHAHRHRARAAVTTAPVAPVLVEIQVPPSTPPIQLGTIDPDRACAEAEVYYEHREFDRAAASLRRAVVLDPGLEPHAQLYDQLARAWDRAMAPDATPAIRFEALRFARRLDLSLGGRYADELDAHLRDAAPLAAIAYAHAHDRDGLELALSTCDALGVPAERTRAARRR